MEKASGFAVIESFFAAASQHRFVVQIDAAGHEQENLHLQWINFNFSSRVAQIRETERTDGPTVPDVERRLELEAEHGHGSGDEKFEVKFRIKSEQKNCRDGVERNGEGCDLKAGHLRFSEV